MFSDDHNVFFSRVFLFVSFCALQQPPRFLFFSRSLPRPVCIQVMVLRGSGGMTPSADTTRVMSPGGAHVRSLCGAQASRIGVSLLWDLSGDDVFRRCYQRLRITMMVSIFCKVKREHAQHSHHGPYVVCSTFRCLWDLCGNEVFRRC